MKLRKIKFILKSLFVFLIPFQFNAQIKVTNNGKIGIGTNNPLEKLHVSGNQFIDSYASSWGSAAYTKVYNQFTCAYNLQILGADEFLCLC